MGCLGTAISVGGNTDGGVDFIRSLLVMEIDEVFMANFGRGWNCAASTGEGLSRVIANDLYKGVEPGDFDFIELMAQLGRPRRLCRSGGPDGHG